MNSTNNPTSPTPDQPFDATAKKYNEASENGKLTRTNFPYEEIQSLPGYKERPTPGLSRSDVTRELARHLTEYAERKNKPLRYSQREITEYLWIQAERDMLPWAMILTVVGAAQKRNRDKPIAHYFGYRMLVESKGKAGYKTFIKLVQYINQEGKCSGCKKEFHFNELTLDHILPRSANGTLELTNVQLMCQPCNCSKGSSYAG